MRTVIVVVDVVDLSPAVLADDVDDGLVVGRTQEEGEGGVGVAAARPGRRRRARRDVRHVERTGERLDRPLRGRHYDAEQREHAVRHRRTYCTQQHNAQYYNFMRCLQIYTIRLRLDGRSTNVIKFTVT